VNDFTRDYGETGREAIRHFLNRAAEAGYIKSTPTIEFVG
jgi:predicted solute-binding protein